MSDQEKRMSAIEALHSRVSVSRLGGEAPSAEDLAVIYKAALRAPDHAQLRPWRFIQIEGAARDMLGNLFAEAQQLDNPEIDISLLDKARSKPLRAPMIIVGVAIHQPHPKVPASEQSLSAGAATQNILLAAHALGIGAMWRTGSMAYHSHVHRGLGLASHESIVSFVYLGEAAGNVREATALSSEDFVSIWTG